MSGKQYNLYTRTNKLNKKVYYVRFKLPDGKWSPGRSTGHTVRSKAETYAIQQLQDSGFIKKPKITLAEYSKDFFSPNGKYYQYQSTSGKRISQRQCIYKNNELKNHILPEIGNYRIIDITENVIDTYRVKMKSQLAGSYVNKLLSDIAVILKHARKDGYIKEVPHIDKCGLTDSVTRGMIRPDEVTAALQALKTWEYDYRRGRYNGCNTPYVAIYTAAATGIRRGELLALQIKNIKNGYIEIEKSYDFRLNQLNETTKNGKIRHIPIPAPLESEIRNIIEKNPDSDNPDSFVFFSHKCEGKRPIEPAVIVEVFYAALNKIGITPECRKKRNISLHSLRRFFNTFLTSKGMSKEIVKSVIGHSTDAMNEHYTDGNSIDFQNIRNIQSMIGGAQ